MKNQLVKRTHSAFEKQFNKSPEHIFLSPGRINIIGEHIDYNDGFVLPAAIDKYICLAIRKNPETSVCTIFSADLNEIYSFKANEEINENSPMWAKYLLGVAEEIRKIGKKIGGLELAFSGNIPMGAGLSSSAALECGFAYALNEIFSLNLSKEEIVLISQKSENNFVGVQCGVMDQFASVFGKSDQAVMVNCDTLEYQYFDAKMDNYSFILLDSCVKHTHLTSGYNDRREEVEKGKKIIKNHFREMKTFRDCTHEMLNSLRDELGEIVYKRCLYVIEEIKRVEDASKALYHQDFELLGSLLNQTHFGLSQQYEVSCPELDFLVKETVKINGVLGARMMGGGFGGCSINLIKNEDVESVIEKIKEIYLSKYNIDLNVYEVKISDGTKEFKENLTSFNQKDHPHRRYNPLLNEWILVSPQRAKRPWQGQQEKVGEEDRKKHDPDCYLCSGNERVNGSRNPDYEGVYVFNNDFGSLLKDEVEFVDNQEDLFVLKPERGINRVVCFSDDHSLTLPEMSVEEIENVIKVWQDEYKNLGNLDYINHVQIFENKGAVMGCSNPHPHGQIWAQSSIPSNVLKTQENFQKYFDKSERSLLQDYLTKELEFSERIILENESFVALVPFWATWPYETMIISKRKIENVLEFTKKEINDFAEFLKQLTIKYDNLFEISFPYSAGIHQAPTDGKDHPEWHFHMHFYPPLLRSASVKKFMVGYEMLAEAQRDITPEQSAEILKGLSTIHYKNREK